MNGGVAWRIADAAAFVLGGDDCVVVLNLEAADARPQALLGSGAAIWRALVGEEADRFRPLIDEERLLAGLAADHGVAPAGIAPEVRAFLTRLASDGLVVRTGEAGPA